MSEDFKTTGADEPAVIRKPIVVPVDAETDDGTRSVTKDRLPGDIVTDAADNEPPVTRKPIVIEPQTEA
ncbi:MAG: hypothetical protein KME14_26745 [Tildeniella torsiva UHER 1998/13D]|nr:hypothetical protein [Tildeniella torsiva UHER 1998/13D]